jgi:hypothetical protein
VTEGEGKLLGLPSQKGAGGGGGVKFRGVVVVIQPKLLHCFWAVAPAG